MTEKRQTLGLLLFFSGIVQFGDVWALLKGLFGCLQAALVSAGCLCEQQLMELLMLLKPSCIFLASFFLSSSQQVLCGCGEKKGFCKMSNAFHPSAIPQVFT